MMKFRNVLTIVLGILLLTVAVLGIALVNASDETPPLTQEERTAMDEYFSAEDIERINASKVLKESFREYSANPLFSLKESVSLWKVLWMNKQQGSKVAPTMEPTEYAEFLSILTMLTSNDQGRISWSALKSMVTDEPLFAKKSHTDADLRGVPTVIVYPVDEHFFAGMSIERYHRAAEVACSIERTLIERYYKLSITSNGELDYVSRAEEKEVDEVTKKIVTNLRNLGLLWENF